jgi:hypothetical protein
MIPGGRKNIRNVPGPRRVCGMDDRPPMDDTELIARCRQGDTRAFESLVNKYQ